MVNCLDILFNNWYNNDYYSTMWYSDYYNASWYKQYTSKTLWMLAQKTNQNIQPYMAPDLMPKELNMNLNKLNNNE